MIEGAVLTVIVVVLVVWKWLKIDRRGPILRPATPCPYCPNPDRDSVFDRWSGCQYDRKAAEASGIIGADPPCVCDSYPTKHQLARLGLAQ